MMIWVFFIDGKQKPGGKYPPGMSNVSSSAGERLTDNLNAGNFRSQFSIKMTQILGMVRTESQSFRVSYSFT